jgi:Glycosyl transferase family 2
MVRNEADIIESFVRYNLQFLDEMIIVLHSPLDDTPQIVTQLKAEGLPLVIERNHELGFSKAEWMNKVARDVLSARRADFLFMLDADEFIKSPSRTYLDEAISAIPVGAKDASPLANISRWVEMLIDQRPPMHGALMSRPKARRAAG